VEPQKKIINELIEDIIVFLPKLISACEHVGKQLYLPLNEQTWQLFGEVVEGMDDLYKTLSLIDGETKGQIGFFVLTETINRALSGINEHFLKMNGCMDLDDYIGAGDFIIYELIPIFQQLAVELGEEKLIVEQRFIDNMKFLMEKYPKLYEQMIQLNKNNEQYQSGYTKNSKPNICIISKENKSLYLYSQYDPVYEAQRWVKTISSTVENKSDIIIYGFGLGYHALSYAEIFPEHNLTIYEPDEQILLAAMSIIDLRSLFTSLNIANFVVGNLKEDRDKLFYHFLKYMKGDPEIISLPIYDKIMESSKREFFIDAQMSIMNYDSSLRMYDKYGTQWITNSMYNLAQTLNTPSIAGLRNSLNDVTAVIVGAGPSLEADIEYLRKLKNHTLIIAAGSSIQALQHYGIKPHLIVSMDGSQANYEAFKNVSMKSIPLLFTPMIEHRIVEKENDYLFHVHLGSDSTTRYFMNLNEEDPTFVSNQSVTGTAIQAAIYMGCKQIVFTGQDFSFPNENMYAPGAKHVSKENINTIMELAQTRVENVKGTMNRTTNGMMLMLTDIEDLIEQYPMIQFINSTQLGAKIKKTTSLSMDEVLNMLKGKLIDEDLLIEKIAVLKKYDSHRVNDVCTKIKQLPLQTKALQQQLKIMKRNIEKLPELSRTNPNKCLSLFNTVDSEWKLIVNSSPFSSVCFTIFKSDLTLFERDLPELTLESNIVRKSKLAYEIMLPLVNKILTRMPDILDIFIEANRRIILMKGNETVQSPD
jgi:hypothetical protein